MKCFKESINNRGKLISESEISNPNEECQLDFGGGGVGKIGGSDEQLDWTLSHSVQTGMGVKRM
jgi:hypothetical protein